MCVGVEEWHAPKLSVCVMCAGSGEACQGARVFERVLGMQVHPHTSQPCTCIRGNVPA